MNAPVSKALLAPPSLEFKLNDQTVMGFEGESILNAAQMAIAVRVWWKLRAKERWRPVAAETSQQAWKF